MEKFVDYIDDDDDFEYDKGALAIIKLVAENQRKKQEAKKSGIDNSFLEMAELNGYKVRTGQWKWVSFKDGYCVFDPRIIVNGKKVIAQKILARGSKEMVDEYIRKHGVNFPPFNWVVDKDGKAVVDNTFKSRASKIAEKAVKREFKEFKKERGTTLFTLNWKDVKKDFLTYTIQPDIESLKVEPIKIEGDMFSPSINDLIKYRSQLPAIQYEISGHFKIIQFDYDGFNKALEICQGILIKKYGEQWKKRRMEKYEEKMKAIVAKSENVKEEQEDESLSVADRLRHKVVDRSIFDEEFELQWDDVKFYDGHYVFEPNMESRAKRLRVEPLRKEDFRCRRSFMSILGHFKNQMPKITYRITKNFKIKISKYPDFEDALIFLAKEDRRKKEAEEFEHREKKIRKLSFAAAMAKADSMSVEELIKNKTRYFNFLIAHQDKKCKVVPIVESIVHTNSRHDEDSFMFTLKSHDGQPFIIVENVNIDRASMVFKARADMYEEALRAVFDYVQSDNKNKRSYVRGGDVDFKNTGVTQCKSIDHDDFDKWKRRMLQYFK